MVTTTPYAQWARQKACDGKRAYARRRDAKGAAADSARFYSEPRDTWRHYRCDFCQLFHIGHIPTPLPGGSRE